MSECQHGTFAANCADCWKERAEKAEEQVRYEQERNANNVLAWQTRYDQIVAALKNQTEIAGKYEERWLAEKQLREQAQAACAEMRWLLGPLFNSISPQRKLELVDAYEHAISNDCGKGWVSPKEHEKLSDALNLLNSQYEELNLRHIKLQAKEREAYDRFDCSQKKLAAAVEALEILRAAFIRKNDGCYPLPHSQFRYEMDKATETLAKIKE